MLPCLFPHSVVGCRRPPVPTHGSTQGVFLHSGARISFHCDPGFELKGFSSAVCLSDGTWSAPAPSCVPVEKVCALPPKPKHGDHFLVYGPNDVLIALQYLCYQPYELSGTNQRTCLPNNTWSGTPPVCTKVNNTLIETEDKHIIKDVDQAKDISDNTKTNKTREDDQENTTGGNESIDGEDIATSHENATAVDEDDKRTTATEEKSVGEDRDEGEPEERTSSSEKPTASSRDTEKGQDAENSLNTVEEKEHEGTKQPNTNTDNEDKDITNTNTDTDNEDKDITDPVVVNKGQEEEERKEKQVNGKKDRDKVGPNDTKVTRVTSEAENTVEIFQIEISKNSTVSHTVKELQPENNTIGSSDTEKKSIPTKLNITQYTLYRAGGEEPERAKEKTTVKDEKTAGTNAEKAKDTGKEKENEEKKKEKEKEKNQSFTEKNCPPHPRLYHGYHQVVPGLEPQTVELICNHSYVLSGDARRTCQPDGTWSGKQPLCLRACREPKVSELVKQRVLPPQTPFRKSPVLRLYSSVLAPQLQSDSPTHGPPSLPQLPPGYHQLYTHIEYECASTFYHHSGSSRRTCLKTGKWSGRHVSCSPVCGKHPTFDQERPVDSHWPWLAAIYRRSSNGMKTKVTKADSLARSPKKDVGATAGHRHSQASDWLLVCSGALVNQRSVVVAAHCVTELGKVYPLDTVKIKVVVGKHHRDDQRDSKGLQHLRVASIVVHPNYDPNILDSDIAVVKLLDKARIGERVLPLCLSAIQEEEVTAGQGLVTGWSPLPDPDLGPDEKARVGLVHLADVVPCEQQYARNGVPVSVTDNMLCAGEKPDYGTSNICPSDTGGILVSPANPNEIQGANAGLWRLLGLVSFGYDEGECDPGLYTVYTRVSNFKDWIESNMK
uniref:Peptidase domain containing associated with muscle regeneration 1b n=1 Tax=Cynoglossus semilaevis TaxID=244447 RepID=A0A3P8W6V2_CYNSE